MAKNREVRGIRPTTISRKTTFTWYFSAFDQISEMHKNPNNSHRRELASGLNRLGLGTFIQDAWKWQDEALCEDFVRNFNRAKLSTTAFGTEVDLSLGTFVGLTGLSSSAGDELYPTEEPCLEAFASSWRKFFADDAYDAGCKGFALSKCKESNVRELMDILIETAWMRRLPRKYKHAPKDLVYFICHCVERKKRVDWGNIIHKKFVDELTRLYMIFLSNKKEKPTTRAGPLMCFLFAQFMDPVGHHEGSSDDLSSNSLTWEHPASSQENIFRESSELLAEEPLEEEKWDEERESRSSWEEGVGIGSNNPTRPNMPDCRPKGSFSTSVDDRMIKEGSTYAELYMEEQKHAEECLKAKLAAERAAESLKAELKEIKRKQQQKITAAASIEEQFSKHQVIVLRQRLEKSMLERDQARAENKGLKMQLKQILVTKHRDLQNLL